jgi:hypothetical protein
MAALMKGCASPPLSVRQITKLIAKRVLPFYSLTASSGREHVLLSPARITSVFSVQAIGNQFC